MLRSRIIVMLAFAAFVIAVAVPHRAVAATPTDAGSLVTPAQVSAVLGVPTGQGERLVASSPKMCGFGGAAAAKRVVLTLITAEMFAHEKHPLQGIQEEQATSLGDDAHYMTTPGFGTGLSVLKGGFVFKVRVYGFPIEQVKQKERMLAQEILANL
jgi:hypothetical protein